MIAAIITKFCAHCKHFHAPYFEMSHANNDNTVLTMVERLFHPTPWCWELLTQSISFIRRNNLEQYHYHFISKQWT